MDDKLSDYLPSHGVFIEAGAADGFLESNTYYLEKRKDWSGILIEPVPNLYQTCIKERPKSKVFNCALVSHDFNGETVLLKQGSLMSTVAGALREKEAEHLKKAGYFYGTNAADIEASARTLTSVLKEAGITQVEFFSLDVEGYELKVLQGLDFNVCKPLYMLIEFLDEAKRHETETYIAPHYKFIRKLSKRDYLYQAK